MMAIKWGWGFKLNIMKIVSLHFITLKLMSACATQKQSSFCPLCVGIILLFSLSSCALSPGYQMTEKGDTISVQYPSTEKDESFPLIPITPELIEQQGSKRKATTGRASSSQLYRIGVNDELVITVWDHPELTDVPGSQSPNGGLLRVVDVDGSIYFPFIGEFEVEDKSVKEVRAFMTEKLSEYLENVQLDVTVSGYKSKPIYVVGEVLDPSSHFMTKGKVSLAEALTMAGGVNPLTSNTEKIYVIRGRKDSARVFRLNAKSPVAINLADKFHLEPHDIVYVGTAGITRWSRVIGQFSSSTNVIGTASGVGN